MGSGRSKTTGSGGGQSKDEPPKVALEVSREMPVRSKTVDSAQKMPEVSKEKMGDWFFQNLPRRENESDKSFYLRVTEATNRASQVLENKAVMRQSKETGISINRLALSAGFSEGLVKGAIKKAGRTDRTQRDRNRRMLDRLNKRDTSKRQGGRARRGSKRR